MKKTAKIFIFLFVFAVSAALLSAAALAEGLFTLDGFPGVSDEDSFYRGVMTARGGKFVWLYDNLLKTATENAESLDLTASGYTYYYEDVKNVIIALEMQQYGDVFYSYSYYYTEPSPGNRIITKLRPSRSAGYSGEYLSRLVSASGELLARAGITSENVNSLTAGEKALRIHDVLAENIVYTSVTDTSFGPQRDQTAYSGIVDGRTVCAGYARAFQLLMTQCGVETLYVSGTARNSSGQEENHAWNLVKEEDGWYFFDLTWDDLSGGYVRYKYYNRCLATMDADHFPEAYAFGYPPSREADGWNPAEDPDYSSVILQSLTDDWYISQVYDYSNERYCEAGENGFTVPYGSSVELIVRYGPGCAGSGNMKVYINGDECGSADKGSFFQVKVYSVRSDVELTAEGFQRAENVIYGSVAVKEEDGVLKRNAVALPAGVKGYYAMWVVDGVIADRSYESTLSLHELEYGQRVQLFVWTDGYTGYLKSEVYVVSAMRIELAPDCVFAANELDGRYSFSVRTAPESWAPVWVAVYDADGRFSRVIMLDEPSGFEIEGGVFEVRFFTLAPDAVRPASDPVSVTMQ